MGFVDEHAALRDGEVQAFGAPYAVFMLDPKRKDELEWDGPLFGWASPIGYAERLMAEGTCRICRRVERRV